MKLQEIEIVLQSVGMSLQSRSGGANYNVKGRSIADPQRVVYRLLRVNSHVLDKLAAEIVRHGPEPRRDYQGEIQRLIIARVMKQVGVSRSSETVELLNSAA